GQISNKVWKTDIESAVDGIEVGGRNLLLDTEEPWIRTSFEDRNNHTDMMYSAKTNTLSTSMVLTMKVKVERLDTKSNSKLVIQSRLIKESSGTSYISPANNDIPMEDGT